jgi:hypothetical protein
MRQPTTQIPSRLPTARRREAVKDGPGVRLSPTAAPLPSGSATKPRQKIANRIVFVLTFLHEQQNYGDCILFPDYLAP